MTKKLWSVLFGAFLFLAMSGAAAVHSADKPVKFKCVAFAPVHELAVQLWWDGIKRINEEFEGEVLFELAGGPEVVPPFELHGAVMGGIVDVAFLPPSYYRGKLPEAEIADYTDCSWPELMEIGFLDDMRKIHSELGLFYLIDPYVGSGEGRTHFYVFTNVNAKSPEELAGKKIRVFPAISPFIKSLGASPALMSPNDIYIALERGVIDGFVDVIIGIIDDYHYEEICDYFIPYGFYRTSVSTLVNQESWDRLTEDLQERILAFVETEVVQGWQDFFDRVNSAETQKVLDAGIKPLEWSREEIDTYLTTAYRSGWESVEKESPGFIEKYGDKYWRHYK